jgi:hypothetical protein
LASPAPRGAGLGRVTLRIAGAASRGRSVARIGGMLLLRLLSTALCAACVVLLATFQPVRLEVMPRAAILPHARAASLVTAAVGDRSPGGAAVNVIDVAPGVPPAQIAALIQLRPDEHVVAVNDRVPASDLEVGALIASLPRRGEFVDPTGGAAPRPAGGAVGVPTPRLAALDLTVSSSARERRVLILLH